MSAADLEAELKCPVCLGIYREPMQLPCGHNLCRCCLNRLCESQDHCSCPECRATFARSPALKKNLKLANIVDCFRATRKTSLGPDCEQKELSLGADGNQNYFEEISSMVASCPEHKMPWEYFCRQHKACLCRLCLESHQSHNWQQLEKAAVSGRAVLADEVARLEQSQNMLDDAESWLQDAQDQLRADRARLKKQVSELFASIQEAIITEERDILDFITAEEDLQLSRLEARIGEILSKKKASNRLLVEAQELASRSIPDWEFIRTYQITLEKLLKADVHIQSFSVQKRELDRALVSQVAKESQVLVKKLSKVIRDSISQSRELLLNRHSQGRAQTQKSKTQTARAPSSLQRSRLTLDPNTAHCNLSLSSDLLSAEWVQQRVPCPSHPERFRLHPQVLCSQGFVSGCHFWDVALTGTRRWEVGVTCKGPGLSWVDSCIAWALRWDSRKLQAFEGHRRHNNPQLSSIQQAPGRIRVCLDREEGTLSFFAVDSESAPSMEAGKLLHAFHIKAKCALFPGFYLEESKLSILQYSTKSELA
ncbi:E3 ubiquitin-protein ligase TRIM7-like [Scleropages formosus]|uniref:E3 ubiquitin-protein ligase TRIM7-like n=1 Tax=Scleropages formosus TaxID=113540 RepID=UPI00087894AD|nr:E3 ubiquitin-protein ligase TRIM7-like [Scleropages formosus]